MEDIVINPTMRFMLNGRECAGNRGGTIMLLSSDRKPEPGVPRHSCMENFLHRLPDSTTVEPTPPPPPLRPPTPRHRYRRRCGHRRDSRPRSLNPRITVSHPIVFYFFFSFFFPCTVRRIKVSKTHVRAGDESGTNVYFSTTAVRK